MGKAKKSKIGGEKGARHAPLAEHILEDKSVRPVARPKDRSRNDADEDVRFRSRLKFFHYRPHH